MKPKLMEMRSIGRIVPLFAAFALVGAASLAGPYISAKAEGSASPPGYDLPVATSEVGRVLFVDKGCVVCHAVNGVGGWVGPALDADPLRPDVDPFDFAVRMWRGAKIMIQLQEMEAGFQIDLTGQELAHIARFLHDFEAQQTFSEDEIPAIIRLLMKEEIYRSLEL